MENKYIKYIFYKYITSWVSALVFVFLPLDFLYRFESIQLYSKPFSILFDISVVYLLLMLIGIMFGLVATLITLSLRTIIRKLDLDSAIEYNNLVVLLFVILCLIKSGKLWFLKTFDVNRNIEHIDVKYKIALIVLLFLILIIRRKTIPYINFKMINYYIVRITIVCAVIVVVNVVVTFGHSNTEEEMIVYKNSEKVKPNIILVTMDALSAEDMSVYKYCLRTTPNLEEFGRSSYVFDNMFANGNWTRPSVASLLMGVRPSTHRLISRSDFNNISFNVNKKQNMPFYLQQNGYECYAIVSNLAYAHPRANNTIESFASIPYKTIPFDYIKDEKRAYLLYYISSYFIKLESNANMWLFNIINDYIPWANVSLLPNKGRDRWDTETPFPVEVPFALARDILSRNQKSNLFIWIHIYPPHDPYLPPNSFRHSFLKERIFENKKTNTVISGRINRLTDDKQDLNKLRLRYDENILYADAAFGDFLQFLRNSGYYENSIILLSADHGESFEHGHLGHGGPHLYQQLVHIPLLIHLPGQLQGKRVPSNMEHVDIAPTILDLIGLKIPSWMEGETMKKAMLGGYVTTRPKYFMELDGNSKDGPLKKGTIGVTVGDFKYIYSLTNRTEELYDIKNDSAELINLNYKNSKMSSYCKKLIFDNIVNVKR
jgi:arylsulfatase A-like enzyme